MLPFSFCNRPKKLSANASSLIRAFASGDAARRDDTVYLGRRRLSGMIDSREVSFSSASSMSREERPKGAVLVLAVERMEVGVRYGSGKGWILV